MLETGRIERIRPATRVRPGDAFHCPDNGDVAIVQSGALVVELMMTGGSVLPLVRYRAGDIAPVLSRLSTPAFSLGYRALELTQMSWLPSHRIDDAVRGGIARARDDLLNASMRQITYLACLPASYRLYIELLRCAQSAGDGPFAMPTHGELSARVCTTRETISRELSILRREGVLSPGKVARLLAPADLMKRIARVLNLERESDVWESFGMMPVAAA
ncbi:Crp/Fnr family transcriptional regulator [Microvirga sp. SRT01]|uniref:Crp/Fnr family transcriptional regulator n=1 Tax=Sphingomonas longa TaxID=2778730 RepID=A0ABS2D4X7_9SPHN|nr:helix-turn-helix domain-containing protein [Microvirga sp. SRT01]MBM6575967.1 Crp/Fnr family transcriptional regulator [Sphingomonas sp. BT552]MBR7709013.1 Crp/Fnr family transcriptional regulator [Microvirga sp. SRT01]